MERFSYSKIKFHVMNKFTVPKPCHENWGNMLSEEKGRYCTSCKTKVYDFSKSSDEEIQEIYDAENGNICGRFENVQLIQYSKFQRIALRFQNFSQSNFSKFGILVSAASLLMSISGCTKKVEQVNTASSLDSNSDSSNLSINTINEITLGAPLPARADSAQILRRNNEETKINGVVIKNRNKKPKKDNSKPMETGRHLENIPPPKVEGSGSFPLGKIAPVRNPVVTEPPKETPPITVGKPMRAPGND